MIRRAKPDTPGKSKLRPKTSNIFISLLCVAPRIPKTLTFSQLKTIF